MWVKCMNAWGKPQTSTAERWSEKHARVLGWMRIDSRRNLKCWWTPDLCSWGRCTLYTPPIPHHTRLESHLLPHDEDDEDDEDAGCAAVAPDDDLREVQWICAILMIWVCLQAGSHRSAVTEPSQNNTTHFSQYSYFILSSICMPPVLKRIILQRWSVQKTN